MSGSPKISLLQQSNGGLSMCVKLTLTVPHLKIPIPNGLVKLTLIYKCPINIKVPKKNIQLWGI